MQDTGLARPQSVAGVWRWIYVGLGLVFVAIAVLGALLPGLPCTPFLLLASYFFSRSSQRLSNWLLRSRLFGGLLRDWQRHRAVRPRVKVVAVGIMLIAVLTSLFLGNLPWSLMLVVVALAGVGATVVLRLPTLKAPAAPVPALEAAAELSQQ